MLNQGFDAGGRSSAFSRFWDLFQDHWIERKSLLEGIFFFHLKSGEIKYILLFNPKTEFGTCSFWGRRQDLGLGEDLCSHPQLSCHFAPGLDLALGTHLVGMDVCFRRSITMVHMGRNAVRWVEKEQ